MRVKRVNGQNEVKLDKGETRRLLEASYILDSLSGVTEKEESDWCEELAARIRKRVAVYGGEHLESDGKLKEPERRKVIDASAPAS